MSQSSIQFEMAESAFLKRLAQHNAHVYPICEAFPAVIRIQNAIRDAKLDAAIFGKNPETLKPETYAQAFERAFKIPLFPTNRKVNSAC